VGVGRPLDLPPVAVHPASPPADAPEGDEAPLALDVDLAALELAARSRIGEMAYSYFSGGAENERLLDDNVAAWGRWLINPRVLVDVSNVSTSTTILGAAVSSPVVVAPTAIQCLAHHEGEVATARGAAGAGAGFVLSSLSNRALEDVAGVRGDAPQWMQIYIMKDRARTEELVARAKAAGFGALCLTVDAPAPGLRLRELRGGVHLPDDLTFPNLATSSAERAREGGFMAVVAREFDPSLTEDAIGWLAGLSSLPVVVKGVERADDALRCVEAGAAGIVVSNHGARQLDDAPATADVLCEVVDAVGASAEVYVDGGIRRAGDVAKALCMGARAVLVGRPVLWALANGGSEGVATLLAWFEAELRRSMALSGAPDVSSLDRSLLRRAEGR
jgi:isopentenyl diphosphate isomerase/L-lactate dehydrogenase-like FMN-dependent dehydrogenase